MPSIFTIFKALYLFLFSSLHLSARFMYFKSKPINGFVIRGNIYNTIALNTVKIHYMCSLS